MKKLFLLIHFACCILLLVTFSLSQSIAQNVGIGTVNPVNKLQVAGSLLVNEVLNQTNTQPTANQTSTLINGGLSSFGDTDSTGRIFDPGGPVNNYIDGLSGTARINLQFSSVGIAIILEDIDLATGDSLIIRDFNNDPLNTYLAFGTGNQAAGTYIINATGAFITFKSNSDGQNGRGFSLLFKRLYSAASPPAATGFAGKALFFDVVKGALRAGSPVSAEKPGFYSVAMGRENAATGLNSIAMGFRSKATGLNAVAIGNTNDASGTDAVAFNTFNTASGSGAAAFGSSTVADGSNAVAFGNGTIAHGTGAVAMGNATQSNGFFTTAMGAFSKASFNYSTAMGYNTTADDEASTAMGNTTIASGYNSTAMGFTTVASGSGSTAMGRNTTASGTGTTAMGSFVSTGGLTGCLIIGDNSTTTVMVSATANSFRARFAGGYRFYTNSALTTGPILAANTNAWAVASDRRLKENFAAINGEDFLQKVAAMPLTTWNYKGQDAKTYRHYGPMAQDFFAAFGKDSYGSVGDDTTINSSDFDGVNLIAIQALEQRTRQLTMDNGQLNMENKKLADGQAKLEAKNEALEARLKKLESLLQITHP